MLKLDSLGQCTILEHRPKDLNIRSKMPKKMSGIDFQLVSEMQLFRRLVLEHLYHMPI